jgi:hypothetical protein
VELWDLLKLSLSFFSAADEVGTTLGSSSIFLISHVVGVVSNTLPTPNCCGLSQNLFVGRKRNNRRAKGTRLRCHHKIVKKICFAPRLALTHEKDHARSCVAHRPTGTVPISATTSVQF